MGGSATDILYIQAGSRRGQAETAVRQGAKGLVVAGTGAGSTGNLAKELTGIERLFAGARAIQRRGKNATGCGALFDHPSRGQPSDS